MIPGSGEKGHGKEKGSATWDVSEAVLQRGSMPGVSGIAVLAEWLCLPQMRLPSWIPAFQRMIPVCPMPHQTSVTAGTVLHKTHMPLTQLVSGVLFCVPGQAGHLSRSTGGNAWNDL